MPEILEVEYYRRLAEEAVGRRVNAVDVADPRCLRDTISPSALASALVGLTVTGTRRTGKLLLLELAEQRGRRREAHHSLGLRFGMTGGLVLDQVMAIDRLRYSPGGFGAQWVRFGLGLAGGGQLLLHDPRRFGRVELDPDESRLGPDALSVSLIELRAALAAPTASPGGGPALKARLLDQARLAGVGNLLADEVLWRTGLAPGRPIGSLSPVELRRLHRHLRATLDDLLARGGSHTGELMEARVVGGRCPRDGAELIRSTVGGRTTYWCPHHQK